MNLNLLAPIFGDFNIKGAEIIPKLCPYCHGGAHGDKNTFALNTENHTFNCQRAAAGNRGTSRGFCETLGSSPTEYIPRQSESSTSALPSPLSAAAGQYRGISVPGVSPMIPHVLTVSEGTNRKKWYSRTMRQRRPSRTNSRPSSSIVPLES